MSAFNIRLAAHHIHFGGIIAYPTEAVYGLGCDPFNAAAVFRLLALKQRAMEKGLILIAANFDQITPFILPLTAQQQQTLTTSWPGPITWLIPAKPSLPPWLTGNHPRIALRITAHPTAKALCEATGHAIVSTSANPSKYPPAKSPLTVSRYFYNRLDYLLTGPIGKLQRPTPIQDLVSGEMLR